MNHCSAVNLVSVIIASITLTAVSVFFLGATLNRVNIVTDCERFGAFSAGDKMFECKLKEQ